MKGILYGIILGAAAINGFADNAVFRYSVGRIEVFMMVESRGQGNSGILVGDAAAIARYVPGGTYPSEVNTFLIKTPEQIVVVDTGFGGAIFENMRTLGVSPADVDVVLLTHLHGDHTGGLQREGRALFPKAKLYLAKQERDYWTRENPNNGAVSALAPYASRTEVFFPGQLGVSSRELVPGIIAIAAFGHTPGHTIFLLQSEGRKLLIWGDLMHAESVQFPRPDISVTYDTDPAAAAAVRRQVLEYAAANRIPIAGMHLVYPAVGAVQAEGNGYRLIPAE
ncbi:MAG: MBL fold metallo-hydrolase [Treponema sp.]|jgi:glyoxylase-like metal-dependent hydrolase (beta-lactamase superfamily II)|nr:MBL fold metallo-hydrolase [Treponema sp.]